MKSLFLDAGAGFLFLAVLLVTHSVAAAVAVGGAASIGVVAWLLASRRPVAPIQWLSLALVLGLGGASLLTRDPRFVMVKPSLVQACVGAALLQPGWMRRYLTAEQLARLPDRAVVATGYAYAGLLFALAAANLVVALLAEPAAWAAYNSAGPLAAFVLMGAGVYLNFRRLTVAARAA